MLKGWVVVYMVIEGLGGGIVTQEGNASIQC